jgi:hypothetical protein
MNLFSKLLGRFQFKNKGHDKKSRAGLFGSTKKERKSFFVSFGKVVFSNDSISISHYPFKPSTIYPSGEISGKSISDISISSCPPTIRLNKELLFISATLKDDLGSFAHRNKITLVERPFNWDFILDPFLDTSFTQDDEARTTYRLVKNGITEEEIAEIRSEVKDQIMKYNFDTMLWEWVSLGLFDVLQAMRPKLNEKSFADFYWKAMEIALRGS